MPDPNGSVFGVVRPNAFSHGYMAFLPSEYDANPAKSYPLIIHLHGAGEIGDGTYNGTPTYAGRTGTSQLQRVLVRGPLAQIQAGYTNLFNGSRPAIVVQPQTANHWNSASSLRGLIDTWKARWRVDVDQIHLCGLSMGGAGVWMFAITYGTELCTAVSACPAAESVTERNLSLLSGCTSWVVVAADDTTSGGLPTYALGRVSPATQVGWAGQIARDRAGITGDPQPLNTYSPPLTFDPGGTFVGVINTQNGAFDNAAGWSWITAFGSFIGKPYLYGAKRVNATLLQSGGHAGAWDQLFGTNAAPNRPFWRWMLGQKRGVAPTAYVSSVSVVDPGAVTTGTTVVMTATCLGPDLSPVSPDSLTWTSVPAGHVTAGGTLTVPAVPVTVRVDSVIDGETYAAQQSFTPIGAGTPPMSVVLNDTFTEAASTLLTLHVSDSGAAWSRHVNFPGDITIDPTTDEAWCSALNAGTAAHILSAYAAAPAQYDILATFINRGGTAGTTGITFRSAIASGSSGNTYYSVRNDGTQWQLFKTITGTATSLGTFAQTLTVGQSYDARIEVRNATKKLFVDGVERISTTDDTIASTNNRIGIRAGTVQSATTGIHITSISVDDLTPLGGVIGTEIADRRVYQRVGTEKSITFAGTYTGLPSAVQVRVVPFGGGTPVVDWTATTFGSGSFSAAIVVPQGGWYQWEARSTDGVGAVIDAWTGGNRWGVGIILACLGQSNMYGWGDTVYTVADDRVSLLRSGTTWERLVEPWVNGGRASIGPTVANALVAALNIPVSCVVHAPLGSGLYGGSGAFWGFRNSGSPTDVTTVYGVALGYLQTAGGCEMILWNQGATDAVNVVSGANYTAALAQLKAWFESDLGLSAGALKLFTNQVGRRVTSGATDAGYNTIRAEHRAWDNGVDRFCVGSTLDFPIIAVDGNGSQSSHYGGASMVRLGNRYARAILFSMGVAPNYGGPFITSAKFADTNGTKIRVTITPRGGSDFTPVGSISGFRVEDGTGAKIITAAVRVSASVSAFTIDITVSAVCTGVTKVQYGYGYNPGIVDSMLLDNQAATQAILSDGTGVVVSAYVPGASGDPDQPTLVVKDADGVRRTVFTINPNGQATAEKSQPVALPQSQIDDLRSPSLANGAATENTLAALNAKLAGLSGGRSPTKNAMSLSGNRAAATANPGTNWTALPNVTCLQCYVSAPSGVTIEVRQGGAGDVFPVPGGTTQFFGGVSNLNTLEVRRQDVSNTPATVSVRWEA